MSQSLPRTSIEEESAQLRAELKQWERDFVASHSGRKAGREDIKQFPEIASKYKTYDKLRQTLAKSSQSDAKPASNSKRPVSFTSEELGHPSAFQTPSKRAKHAHPLHSHPVHPAPLDRYENPTSTATATAPATAAATSTLLPFFLSPSRARTSLGPTPQKDGQVLGLFDALSSSSSSRRSADRTPSRRKILDPVTGNASSKYTRDAHAATPSKCLRQIGAAEQRQQQQQQVNLPGSASKGQGPGPEQQGPSAVFTPSGHGIGQKTQSNCTPVRDNKNNDNNDNNNSGRGVLQGPEPHFDDTPAFLRRNGGGGGGHGGGGGLRLSLQHRGGDNGAAATNDGDDTDTDDENALAWSPIKPMRVAAAAATRRFGAPGGTLQRRPPLLAGRGLSALVRGLREMEDARWDEELEVLREVEVEVSKDGKKKYDNDKKKTREKEGEGEVLVADSQRPPAVAAGEMPLGPDRAAESETDEDEEGEGYRQREGMMMRRGGKALGKVWKKKGQKRTTRAVKMRPNVVKWKPEPVWKGGVDAEEEEEEEEEEDGDEEEKAVEDDGRMEKTQSVNPRAATGANDGGAQGLGDVAAAAAAAAAGDTDKDDNDDDIDTESEKTAANRPRKLEKKNDAQQAIEMTKAKDESGKGKGKGKEGIVQKVKKKMISATAHANFRALKIRNKNSRAKGGGGGGGRRFGRKR